ncbi:MFS transporter [Streptomyces sp. NPDC017529]|uniref:MFS transporter n=1 Tax=Streptomyces sp. NPDC017529 TaxID=3365000 RepID=UPI0037BA662E
MTVWEGLLGARVTPPVRMLLILASLGYAGQWTMTAYLTIYVVTTLPVTQATAGLLLAAASAAGLVAGPTGGRLADATSRRTVLLLGTTVQAAAALLLLLVPREPAAGIGAAALLTTGATLRTTALNALAADVSTETDRDTTFALMRMVMNIAAVVGTALGAVLVPAGWQAVWATSLAATLLGLVLCRWLQAPGPGGPAPTGGAPADTVSYGAEPSPAPGRKRAVRVAAAASLLACTVYNCFEIVFPVAAVREYGLSPSVWGLLFLLNPVIVLLFQVRLVAWTGALNRGRRLMLATCLMGASFMILTVTRGVAAIAAVVVVFTVGEILLGPTMQGLLIALAPADKRAGAMGLLSAATTGGVILTTAGGIPLLAAAGGNLTWTVVTVVAVASGLLFGRAHRAAVRTTRGAPQRA